jgi:predicted Zn-dependent peptidase
MNKILVDQKQIALAALALPFFNEDAGLFLNYAIASMGVQPAELERVVDSVVNTVKTGLVPEKEFQKVRNKIETEFVTSNATMAGIAESLANYEVYFGDANLINTEIARYNKVTREDILNVAKKYLNKDNRVVLHYVPKAAKTEAGNNL